MIYRYHIYLVKHHSLNNSHISSKLDSRIMSINFVFEYWVVTVPEYSVH